jgi:prolyl-tRNA editing enzyme YbaK/EbsC (Cys-tRNA(Pro) deacylase)
MSNQKSIHQGDNKSDDKTSSTINYLVQHEVDYEVIPYQDEKTLAELAANNNINLCNILLGVVCTDEQGDLLVVLQADMLLDTVKICKGLNRTLVFADPKNSSLQEYYNQKLATYPPLPYLLGVEVIFDSNIKDLLSSNGQIYFSSGQDGILLRVSSKQFQELHEAVWSESIGVAINTIEDQKDQEPITKEKIAQISKIGRKAEEGKKFIVRRMRTRVKETFELPIMPPMADELLKLRVDPTANAKSLAKLVSKDPSLSAQLISWACSPYYGYPGKITSLDDAIIKVLGYDLVMNISLGIAIGQIMRIPNSGPLGLNAYWRQAIYAATLIENLINIIPVSLRPYRGLGYLC